MKINTNYNNFYSFNRVAFKSNYATNSNNKTQISATSLLIAQRTEAKNIQDTLQAEINKSDTFNERAERRRIDYSMDLEISQIGSVKKHIPSFISQEKQDIIDKWEKVFEDKLIDVNYIRRHKSFFMKIIEQQKDIINNIDKKIIQLNPGKTLQEILGQYNPQKEEQKVQSYVPIQVKGSQNSNKPLDITTKLTSDLAKIQKELDPSIDTTKMSFGDLAYLLEKKIRSDETPQALKRQWSDTIEKAKAENVSFIPNIKITSEDLSDTIIDKSRKIINNMHENEASALDGLKWLQENGHFAKDLNFSPYEDTTFTILDDVTCSLRGLKDNGQMTNTVLDKYIDIYNKLVKSWTSYGFVDGDAENLEILFSENAKIMNKDIAFKFLEALEKTGLHNGQAYQFKLDSQDLKLDDKSRKEFLNRIEILLNKLPDYKKSN